VVKQTLCLIRTSRLLILGLLLLCVFSSCDPVTDELISPEEFQKFDQEILGDQLYDALISPASPFDIVPREDNEVLYTHIESLYEQSYFIMRARQGWTTSRQWKISIFLDDNQSAFTFPGGNLMISTGMLKSFRKEYELFYLLTFENSLVDSGHLFANFLTFVEDSIDIANLIEQADQERALSIAMDMFEVLDFNAFITQEADLAAMQWICESSNFRVDGISDFLPRLAEDSNWLVTRESSLDRLQSITSNFLLLDCDNSTRITSLGNDFYINEILPLVP
jgi:hypothetical protein